MCFCKCSVLIEKSRQEDIEMNTNDVYGELKLIENMITVSFILTILMMAIIAWVLGVQ